MRNPRLVYRALLKLLILLGLLALLYVLFNSLFIGQSNESKDRRINKTKTDFLTLDLSDMNQGQIRKIRWHGREIIILKYAQLKGANALQYAVFFNTGDSGSCPLFYSSNTFKDTCTGTMYDLMGREKNKAVPKSLSKPPYVIKGSVLTIGQDAATE